MNLLFPITAAQQPMRKYKANWYKIAIIKEPFYITMLSFSFLDGLPLDGNIDGSIEEGINVAREVHIQFNCTTSFYGVHNTLWMNNN